MIKQTAARSYQTIIEDESDYDDLALTILKQQLGPKILQHLSEPVENQNFPMEIPSTSSGRTPSPRPSPQNSPSSTPPKISTNFVSPNEIKPQLKAPPRPVNDSQEEQICVAKSPNKNELELENSGKPKPKKFQTKTRS